MTDRISTQARSLLMGRIKGKNTGPEKTLAKLLRIRAISFRQHGKKLPGRPDFYFPLNRVAVFVDGDFWHGWRFPTWSAKLKPFWHKKITDNRMRDRRVNTSLRRLGWRVIRVWEHQLERSAEKVTKRILNALRPPTGSAS